MVYWYNSHHDIDTTWYNQYLMVYHHLFDRLPMDRLTIEVIIGNLWLKHALADTVIYVI